MKCYFDEMNEIFQRLKAIESVINPEKILNHTDNTHPLSKERDELTKRFWELRQYDNGFLQRKNPIIVSMHITGCTPMQTKVNYAVAYNT